MPRRKRPRLVRDIADVDMRKWGNKPGVHKEDRVRLAKLKAKCDKGDLAACGAYNKLRKRLLAYKERRG